MLTLPTEFQVLSFTSQRITSHTTYNKIWQPYNKSKMQKARIRILIQAF